MTRHVFFDLDGTLTLPARGIVNCIRHALEVMGAPDPGGDLSRYVGPPLRASFAELLQTDDASEAERAVAAYRDRFATVGYLENEVVAGIEDCLDQVRVSGRTLYVVTSKPAVYARRIVEHFGLDARFARVHGPDLEGNLADKTELIAHVLRTHGIEPAQATMIGDRRHDIEGARANGVRAFGVLWGYGSHDELDAARADAVFAEVAHLTEALCA